MKLWHDVLSKPATADHVCAYYKVTSWMVTYQTISFEYEYSWCVALKQAFNGGINSQH